MIDFCAVYFPCAISKWAAIFKYYFLPWVAMFGTVKVSLTSMYASLLSHKPELNMEVLNLI